MHTNISNYNVIYNGVVLNAIEMEMYFEQGQYPCIGNRGEFKPNELSIVALDSANQIVVITDESKKFQFIRKVS